jgi:hypothetical protein
MARKDVSEQESNKRVGKVNLAFPDALVQNYEGLIEHLQLPDEKDRHVLAAAIKTNANIIVTNNIKDFPEEYLQSFSLRATTTDDFLTDIIDLNPKQAVDAFREMVLNKKNPPLDDYQVLNQLRNIGLNNSANYLQALIT